MRSKATGATALVLCWFAGVQPAAPQTTRHPRVPPGRPTPEVFSRTGTSLVPAQLQETETPNPRLNRMVLGGLLGGAVGFAGGLYLGDKVVQTDDLALVFAWGLGVESLALPLGVHFGNEGRGNPLPGGFMSLALGIVGGLATHKSRTAAIVPVFVLAQLIAAVALESRSTPP